MSKRISNQIKDQIIKEYQDRIPVSEISKKYNVSTVTVDNIRKSRGIPTRKREREYIKDEAVRMLLQGDSCTQIALRLNVSRATISKALTEKGYDLISLAIERNRLVNCNYFSDLEDSNVNYWLGMLATDGSLGKVKPTIQLGLKDKEHIKLFSEFLSVPWSSVYQYQDSRYKNSWMYTLKFTHKETYDYLHSLGITNKKSLNLDIQFPITYDFLRGVIDGDGCISPNGRNGYKVSIVTISKVFAHQLHDFYISNGYSPKLYSRVIKDGSNTVYSVLLTTKVDVEKLYYNLYCNCLYYMKRKKDDFISLMGNDMV